jgi:hypothetical protein
MKEVKPYRGKPSRPQRALLAGIGSGLLGLVVGGIIGASLDEIGTVTGALVGAVVLGVGEALTDATRERGQLKPEAWRIFGAVVFGAALGGLLRMIFEEASPVLLGVILGAGIGLLELGMNRLAIGASIGLLTGVVARALYPDVAGALLGGVITLLYRLASRLLKRQEPLQLVGEQVAHEQVRFVVPFEANSRTVGADYFMDLARTREGTFKRNAPGIGIVDSMESLRGPYFDPDRVDPLIREFYEHTSRFKLHIVPVWKRRMLPLFWLFKRMIARRIGQANLPFDIREAQRGVVSYIDTIDFDCDDIIDLRGWVRAFDASGEAIYVGVYTTFRHAGVGYVSVGFPLPGANFTATLLPYNLQGSDFLLKTHNLGFDYPGHYLSVIDRDTAELSVVRLPTFGEEIEVYVQDGRLRTDHRFYLSGLNFLTLLYSIERDETR